MLKVPKVGNTSRVRINDGSLTVGTMLRQAMRLLKEQNVESAMLDARLLAAETIGCEPGEILFREHEKLDKLSLMRFDSFLDRRLLGEPIAHILGRRDFWKDEFLVSPETLVPRPDSEVLVETVLEQIPNKKAPLSVLDLGTGTGCLLLSLLRDLPNAFGLGVDKNGGAVTIAGQNAQRLDLASRSNFLVSDWFSNVQDRFDIIVANPPYIVDKDIDGLDRDVREYEPRLALDGGPDGLSSYRVIAQSLSRYLKTDGFVAIEFGADQLQTVREVFESAGFCIVKEVQDLAGRDRCVLLR